MSFVYELFSAARVSTIATFVLHWLRRELYEEGIYIRNYYAVGIHFGYNTECARVKSATTAAGSEDSKDQGSYNSGQEGQHQDKHLKVNPAPVGIVGWGQEA